MTNEQFDYPNLEDTSTIRFVGIGSPTEALAQQRKEQQERIERVKRFKNKKAREAKQRANSLLADLGLSRKERQAVGKRQREAQSKKPKNYRWDPSGPVQHLETEP